MADNPQSPQSPQPPHEDAAAWIKRQWERVRNLSRRDVIITQVGEGSQNIAAGKNIFQINVGGRNITPYILLILLATLLIAGVVAYPTVEPFFFPSKMTHDFNIAVADIGLQDPGGAMHQSDFGDDISQSIFSQLADAYKVAAPEIQQTVQIWHDSLGREAGKNIRLGYIDGATPEQRTRNAAALATRINADMIVYGYLTDATNPESLVLELYYDRQAKAGEINPTWGSQHFGASLAPAAPYASNPGNARLTLRQKLEPRTQALFWLTQAFAYQVINQPDTALQILLNAEQNLTTWKPQDGKEVLYFFISAAALYARQYDVALKYANQALDLDKTYIPALLVRAGIYFDRAQLYALRGRTIPPNLQVCYTNVNIENSDRSLDDAIASTLKALDDLNFAARLAPTSEWPDLQYRVQLQLGQVYRLLGQWRDYQAVLTPVDATAQRAAYFAQALKTLDQSEQALNTALVGFPPATQPVYHAWAQMALGQVNQFRGDVATRTQSPTTAVPWFKAARDHYDACIALRDQTQGNILFQDRVLNCGCIPSRVDVQAVISQTLEVTQ